jgi:FkbM family methyltransferase
MNIRNKLRGLRELWHFDNRWYLIVTRTFFPRQKLHAYTYRGQTFISDHEGGDANGAREVLTSRMYRRFLPLMDLHHPLNVLDLGANNGGFPLMLKACGLDLARVVSVELNPRTFIRLYFNLARNLPDSTIALNLAACGRPRELDVFLGTGATSDNIYRASDGDLVSRTTVQGVTVDALLDEFFPGLLDICKIDIEGAEFEVFRSGTFRKLNRCRYIIIEIHEQGGKPLEVISALESIGFARLETLPGADPTVHFFEQPNWKKF